VDGELVADRIVHAFGLVIGALGAVALLVRAGESTVPGLFVPVALYAGGLLAMLTCSAAYHLWQSCPWRDLVRRLDHAAIFLMIAGTYTPLTLLRLSEPWSSRLTIIVWTAASVGVATKLWQPRRVEPISIALYLLLGWIGLIAIESLVASLDRVTLILLLVGGVIYSAGVMFHVSDQRRYHRALWHGCVLVAATVHYWAIIRALPLH
jgi:hemolysin III